MVKILSLHAVNFKRLSFEQPLKMPEGVTLVCGPNESGKSTLLDAILYALYARVIRPSSRPTNEDLITYGKNRALVRLDFSVGDRTFRVERQIYLKRPNTARLWEILPSGFRLIATGQRPVTEEIEKLLGGISFHELISSNVVAQKDLEHLIEQGKEERKRVINTFLNLESFNKVLQDLNEERKNIEGTPSRPGKLTIEKQKLEGLQEKFREYEEKREHLQETRQKIKKLKQDIKNLEERLNEVKKLCDVLEEYNRAYEEKRELSARIEEKRRLLQELENQLKNLEKVEEKLGQTLTELEEYADLEAADKFLESANSLNKRLSELRIQIKEKREREKEIKDGISQIEKTLQGIDVKRASRLEKERVLIWPYIIGAIICFLLAFMLFTINMLIPYVFIPVLLGILFLFLVGRQISTESKLRQVLSDLKRLENLKDEFSILEDQIDNLTNGISETEQEIMNVLQGIKRYQKIFDTLQASGPEAITEVMRKTLETDKQSKNRLEERIINLKAQLEGKPVIIARCRETDKELSDLRSALRKIKFPKLPEGITFSKDLLEQTRTQREGLGKRLTKSKTLLEESQEKVEELTRFIEENKDLPEKLEKQKEEVKKLEHRLKVVRISIEALNKTAEALRNRVHPNVEQYMGVILPEITNGRYKAVQIDRNYNLKVWDPDAGEFKLKEVFSGGTEDQFLLSMRLAFALALLPEVKGMHPEFLFLDEPLASSDEERREGIIRLLKELRSRFKQIFIISHIASLETEVQNIIRMENGQITKA